MIDRGCRWLACVVALVSVAIGAGQDRKNKVLQDRERFRDSEAWIYNDLAKGVRDAERSGKPMLVVLRCIPCEACAKFDDEVAQRQPEVRALMDQFVCVRQVMSNNLDLSLFQFDYDQSFAVMFLNADGTIYGRFGTRSSHDDAEADITTASFRAALAGALALHRDYPNNKQTLAGKRGGKPLVNSVLEFPNLKGKYTAALDYDGQVVKSCVHCHQIGEAQRTFFRAKGERIPDDILFPYPMPALLGLEMDPNAAARVAKVAPDSVAAHNNFRAGDEIVTLAEQPIISTADLQWVLHRTTGQHSLLAKVRRGDTTMTLPLPLPEGWRRRGDISWRPSTWELRRMVFGGMVLKELDAAARAAAGIEKDRMALKVNHVGEYGDHAVAKRAGFVNGDIIVSFDDRDAPTTESSLIADLLARRKRGDKVAVAIVRKGERKNLRFALQ